ncbi:MAG: hypothetical protein GY898_02710 [Proteobacteria bacterium]|nr:hypothetical protein [Pseudomonadota bacterium]
MAHFRTPLLLLLVTLVSVGCAHTRSPIPTSALPKVPVEFEPIRIVTQTDDLIGLDAYDGDDLFALAYQAFDEQDFDRAVRIYDVMLEQFPEHPGCVPARFNRALGLEKLGRMAEGADGFADYAALVADSSPYDAAEAFIREATLRQHLDDYVGSIPAIQSAQQLAVDLDSAEAWQLRILAVMVGADEGSFESSEFALNRVRRELRRATLQQNERYPYTSAMVWYAAGELYRMRARAVSLDVVDDVDLLDRRLGEKAGLLLEARQHLKRSLVHRMSVWSGPSALALGAVYEDFRNDLLAAPRPAGLSDEAGRVYDELLAERTRQFLEKAAVDYREVLKLSESLRLEAAWVDAIQAALDRCETELVTGFTAQAGPLPKAAAPGDG